ncbi:uncharacterized protein FFUJ_00302 [Fusarium fujikuroi IMI 58289]|uniref:Uncharacterized protein n=1 Tax=Gibberella fujikuroi (strain CBS 195.34 / IMI 58289 / NRRL A-6831) TaxID=1279085 RepID=S0DM49_GIBF5|nr:LOW QUALITY PROTEIN: uncharacterized protein FFUJ_00302 [Fusarium fujikuroi IMI 58289]CCT63506.1 uncharacterized protein FFUJ_00302 [Fusarium fujikuroi IMI 58289]
MAIIDINTIIDPPMKLAGKGERCKQQLWMQWTLAPEMRSETRIVGINAPFKTLPSLTYVSKIAILMLEILDSTQSGGPIWTNDIHRIQRSIRGIYRPFFLGTFRRHPSILFAIGLDAPATGGFRAGVVESDSAKQGLEIATRQGNSITLTDRYKGKDSDGDDRLIEFHLSAYSGVEIKVVITQLILNSNDD